jgi:SAM-dependent methyltransferase
VWWRRRIWLNWKGYGPLEILGMVENRQALADVPLRNRDLLRHPKAICRYWVRVALFSFPPLRRWIEREPASPKDVKKYWDTLTSQTNFATYLGGTINVDSCNAMTAMLIKYHAPENPAVLDVGCCGGTLALALRSFSAYLGTDVSSHAITVAKSESAFSSDIESGRISFQVADLREFHPANEAWDVIVFNEVLYYLKSDYAAEQVTRYARALKPGGIICISMKDDAKSHVIFRLLAKRFKWEDGMLWQRKATSPEYSISINRERPATLLGVLRL